MKLQVVCRALLAVGIAALAGPVLPAAAQSSTPEAPAAAAAAQPDAGNRIQAGQERTGALGESDPHMSDGTFYRDWIYVGRRGERLTITLRSEAFDAYVRFGRMRGGEFAQIAERDDGAGGSDSRLQVTLPADGEYVIRVNTFLEGSGAYRLKVESGRG